LKRAQKLGDPADLFHKGRENSVALNPGGQEERDLKGPPGILGISNKPALTFKWLQGLADFFKPLWLRLPLRCPRLYHQS
jgi:hypothetical protein